MPISIKIALTCMALLLPFVLAIRLFFDDIPEWAQKVLGAGFIALFFGALLSYLTWVWTT